MATPVPRPKNPEACDSKNREELENPFAESWEAVRRRKVLIGAIVITPEVGYLFALK
jgi:hypothetical protein